jgi:hypothetical protein
VAWKVLIGLLAIASGFCAVAYAATAPGGHNSGSERRAEPAQVPTVPRPARPRLTQHPAKLAVATTAQFGFAGRGGGQRFECRLDGSAWKRCRPPLQFAGLAPGRHSFSVRAVSRAGVRGAATRFRWRLLEPQAFSVVPLQSNVGALYPGAPPSAVPVRIENPNPVRIYVTGLRVAVSADAPGCTAAENLALTAASVSAAAPLAVPAGGSVELPVRGAKAPTIQLRDLPVNQDACQDARFPLRFAGSAHG